MGSTLLNHSNAVSVSNDPNSALRLFCWFANAVGSVGSVVPREKFIFCSPELQNSLEFCLGSFPENVTSDILGCERGYQSMLLLRLRCHLIRSLQLLFL